MFDYSNDVSYTNTDVADSAAKNAYYDAQSRGADASSALAAAKQAWQQKMDEATQTGMWNGQWSFPSNKTFMEQFGSWMPNGPTPGMETMAREQQTFNQGQQLGSMYGQYYAPGQAPAYGTETQEALNRAQQNAYQTAGITGWYTPTQNTNVSPARFSYDADAGAQQAYIDAAQGDRNLAAQRWAADASNAVRQFNEQHPAQAQQTLTGQQQQWNQAFQQQGYEAQQRQLAQQNTLAYLGQLAQLRGPADWAKYQEVLGSTPQGMRDLYAAAMGQYTPGGGATTGVQPQAVNLNTMMQQIGGYNPQAQAQGGNVWGGGNTPQQGGAPTDVYNSYWNQTSPNNVMNSYGSTGNYYGRPSEQQNLGATAQAQNYLPGTYQGQQPAGAQEQVGAGFQPRQANLPQAQGGQMTAQTWGSGIGIGNQGATPAQQQQATGNGTNMFGAQQQQYNMPAPNQIAPQSWQNLTPSQQQLMLGNWEAQGYYKPDVEALYNQSLPQYGSNKATAGTWRTS